MAEQPSEQRTDASGCATLIMICWASAWLIIGAALVIGVLLVCR